MFLFLAHEIPQFFFRLARVSIYLKSAFPPLFERVDRDPNTGATSITRLGPFRLVCGAPHPPFRLLNPISADICYTTNTHERSASNGRAATKHPPSESDLESSVEYHWAVGEPLTYLLDKCSATARWDSTCESISAFGGCSAIARRALVGISGVGFTSEVVIIYGRLSCGNPKSGCTQILPPLT